MANRFSNTQTSVIDRDARNMAAAGYPLGTELNALWAEVDQGNIGIKADAWDVDSLAIDGGAFSVDQDNTDGATSGFTFAWLAGRVAWGKNIVATGSGSLEMSPSTTNFVEVNSAGVVSVNASAFTSGLKPLYLVATGSGGITAITNVKTLLVGFGLGMLTGDQLSTAAATKELIIPLGDIGATAAFSLIVPNVAGNVVKADFITKTAIVTDDTDYWTFGLVNKGAAGAGTAKIVDSTSNANSTKATGGSSLSAYVPRALTLGTVAVAARDAVELTLTKAASATTMAQCALRLDVQYAG